MTSETEKEEPYLQIPDERTPRFWKEVRWMVWKRFQKVAPFLDSYDLLFAFLFSAILFLGAQQTISITESTTLVFPGPETGALAIITALTAFLALYRLRHHPEKTRPAVRQDVEKDGELLTDYGLRNFGPGAALYLQAVATIKDGDFEEPVQILAPRDEPLHLREGEFVGVVDQLDNDWLDYCLDEHCLNREPTEGQEPATVNLYYSYLSTHGTRTPLRTSAERNDQNILRKLMDSSRKPRRIELEKLRPIIRAQESSDSTVNTATVD